MIIFEDEDLLVVNKPPGWNTHSPSPFAGEGIYEWLRNREPRWAALSILHRLDKETSGVLLFGKTRKANQSITAQFTERTVRKKYQLLATSRMSKPDVIVESALVRAGEKYLNRPATLGSNRALTSFREIGRFGGNFWLIEAEPTTGLTHQIRVHAAASGFPIVGDSLYGGQSFGRLCLHAAELSLRHPTSGRELKFAVPARFDSDRALLLREAILDSTQNNCCRLIHGASDGWPGFYVEQLGKFLLCQSPGDLTPDQSIELTRLLNATEAIGAYHKRLNRGVGQAPREDLSPRLVMGEAAPERFSVLENGIIYELSFSEGYSVGIFLDQRDNRRRLLTRYVAPEFVLPEAQKGRDVLNVFAYTCAFSVCAARAGASVTSLDLSKKYLDWGRKNFELNQLDPNAHDFIFGDAFDWMRRLTKKGRRFSLIVLDPPTFSKSKEQGTFRADKDFGRLLESALMLLAKGGVILASTNAAGLAPVEFLNELNLAARNVSRTVLHHHFSPQPPDFPVSREEPAYLKTIWLQFD